MRTQTAQNLLRIARDLIQRYEAGEPIGDDDMQWARQMVSNNKEAA